MARSSAKGNSSATGSMPEQQLMLECQLVETSTLPSRLNKLTSQHQVCILVCFGQRPAFCPDKPNTVEMPLTDAPIHRVSRLLVAVNADALHPCGQVLILLKHLLQALTRLHANTQHNFIQVLILLEHLLQALTCLQASTAHNFAQVSKFPRLWSPDMCRSGLCWDRLD